MINLYLYDAQHFLISAQKMVKSYLIQIKIAYKSLFLLFIHGD